MNCSPREVEQIYKIYPATAAACESLVFSYAEPIQGAIKALVKMMLSNDISLQT